MLASAQPLHLDNTSVFSMIALICSSNVDTVYTTLHSEQAGECDNRLAWKYRETLTTTIKQLHVEQSLSYMNY
jgi:hypothetical protein